MTPPSAADDLIGRRIADRYRIDELLARGGMAGVYRAHDERLARDVAVKVLSEPYASDAAFGDRFLGEARTAAGLAHTNLVHVYDSGQDGKVRYIVMELLTRYRTLRQRISADGSLPPREAVAIVREMLAGLATVHDRGFVHADVKSSNVMVGPGPSKLIDFGIARTPAGGDRPGTSIGSLHVMPPEQLRDESLTPPSDLFAVGVVLFEALTGRVPFDAGNADEMLRAQEAGAPGASTLASGVPAQLDDVIAQALRPRPADRFRSAGAMAAALEAALDERVAPAFDETRTMPVATARGAAGYVPPLAMPVAAPAERPRPVPARSDRSPRRHRRGGIGGWIVALAGLAAGAFVVWLVLSSASGPPGTPGASDAGSGAETPSLPAGKVRIPDTVGLSEAKAEQAARDTGLNWTLNFDTRAGVEPGVYDQEPAAGAIVDRGSRFVMYAWRTPD